MGIQKLFLFFVTACLAAVTDEPVSSVIQE